MATEYTLQSDADLGSSQLRTFFESAVGGEAGPDGTVFRPGMCVTAYRPSDDERDGTAELFGFSHRTTATFRFSNLADKQTEEQNIALMVSTVLAFHATFGGRGVLLFNGEVAIIQWSPDDVVFSREWEDWFEVEPVIPLIAGHEIRRLPQPLL